MPFGSCWCPGDTAEIFLFPLLAVPAPQRLPEAANDSSPSHGFQGYHPQGGTPLTGRSAYPLNSVGSG